MAGSAKPLFFLARGGFACLKPAGESGRGRGRVRNVSEKSVPSEKEGGGEPVREYKGTFLVALQLL